MEYVIIIFLLLYGIVKYDFKGRVDRNGNFYIIVYILMVLMSGLAYRVGSDLVEYETSYYLDFKGGLSFNFRDLLNFTRAQPGWIFLSTIVYKTGASFTIFKLIQASFFQFAVFKTIKKYTTYKFTALLLFFVYLFPHVNFNVLRESFAIGFFLLSIPHILNRNWIKYYIYIFCAFMFHSGAALLFICPLFFYINLNSVKKVVGIAAVVFILSLIVASSDLTNTYLNLVQSTGSAGLIEQSEFYLLKDRYTLTGVSNISKSLLFFMIEILPLYYVAKKGREEDKRLIPLAFLYIIVSLISNFVPIMYRYKDYTYLLFFLVLSLFLVDFSKKHLLKQSVLFVFLLFSLYFYSVRSYFAVNEFYDEPAWVQYYPYHSVIDKGTSPVRERTFYNK